MPVRNRPPAGITGRMTTRRVLPDNLTEAQFQGAIVDLAQYFGWRIFHPRTVRTITGHHLTAYTGHAGFPDLVLASPGGVIFAELKTAKGRPTEAQQAWRAMLEAGGAEYYLWRPADWWEIEKRLRKAR